MAIQGSTQAFPLRRLLSFLGETQRTGRLVVQARPQVGLVAVRDGRIVAAGLGRGDGLPGVLTAPDVETLGDVVVELATLPPGRFAFHPDGVGGTASGFDIESVLGVVEALEADYGDASPVRPDHRVQLVAEPSFAAVTVADEHWEVLTTVGDGASVADVAERLGLGLAAVRRRLESLVRDGMVTVDEAAMAGAA